MANRYWVGGTANWDATVGTKWATTSGGAGGASVPTSSDNVFFDANSGSSTVTVTVDRDCLGLNFTGFTGVLNGAFVVNVYDNLVLSSTATISATTIFLRGTTSHTVTSNNAVLDTLRISSNAAASFTLQDNLSCSSLVVNNSIFNTNNFDVTCTSTFQVAVGAGNATVNLGSSTIYCNTWSASVSSGSLTINPGTSEIIVKYFSSVNNDFYGADKTYYKVTFAEGTNPTSYSTVYGSNTFTEIKSTRTSAFNLTFEAGKTTTATTWGLNGSVGKLVTLRSTVSGTQYIFSKAGGGTATLSFIDIKDCIGSPVSTWTATSSTDSGNNTNWTIYTTGPSSGAFFALF